MMTPEDRNEYRLLRSMLETAKERGESTKAIREKIDTFLARVGVAEEPSSSVDMDA